MQLLNWHEKVEWHQSSTRLAVNQDVFFFLSFFVELGAPVRLTEVRDGHAVIGKWLFLLCIRH